MRIAAGPCGDPACHVLHNDPANPIHPPFYEPSGCQECGNDSGSVKVTSGEWVCTDCAERLDP